MFNLLFRDYLKLIMLFLCYFIWYNYPIFFRDGFNRDLSQRPTSWHLLVQIYLVL